MILHEGILAIMAKMLNGLGAQPCSKPAQHDNLAQPIGNLSSPQFGESISTAGSFGFGPSGSAAAGDRRVQVQIRFGF
jgi:hypothetical protein